MAKIEAITRADYADKCWLRSPNYAFAAHDALATLVVQEVPRAILSFPVAFAQVDAHYVPVAVLGLTQGQNLFVDPQGRWLGDYVPATYRGYPFVLAHSEDGKQVLCFDRDSGLLREGGGGEPFFDPKGEPAERTNQILQFLTGVVANREPTLRLCNVLQEHGLIEPWQVRLQGKQGSRELRGLHHINEAALNALPAEAFQEVRAAGALPLVYCQLVSMHQLQKLGLLARARSKPGPAPLLQTPTGDLDLEFLNGDGTIKFH